MLWAQAFGAQTRWTLFGCLLALWSADSLAQQLGGIQVITGRPFVISVTPVIGPNGAVGGVEVDAAGVVSRIATADADDLRATWLQAREPMATEMATETDLRMVSLSRLDRALADLIAKKESPAQEMFFLAGLQRVEFVFVFPEQKDVVLAGPAGPWRMNALGEVVSTKTGSPVLRLDDLIDALRSAEFARSSGITCSIEPTEQGRLRYARLKSRRLTFSEEAVSAMEQALGMQQIILKGIDADSHLARVMVAADYVMKRLAMGFESAPVADMPSYMELLRQHSTTTKVTSPRWWMTTHYEPLRRSADGLAWQIRGPGVKTLTEDSLLNSRGERTTLRDTNPLAQRWADTMTASYPSLSTAISVFGELRNGMDLAVAAALIANEHLLDFADCRLNVLPDASRLNGPRYDVPKSVPSKASLVRGQRGWIVSVSGGVDLDSWSVVEHVETDPTLAPMHERATPSDDGRWWW